MTIDKSPSAMNKKMSNQSSQVEKSPAQKKDNQNKKPAFPLPQRDSRSQMLIALEKDCRNQDAGFRNLSSIFIQAQKEEQRKELERQKNQTTKIDSNWNEEHKVRSSNTRQSKPQINLTHRELRNNK